MTHRVVGALCIRQQRDTGWCSGDQPCARPRGGRNSDSSAHVVQCSVRGRRRAFIRRYRPSPCKGGNKRLSPGSGQIGPWAWSGRGGFSRRAEPRAIEEPQATRSAACSPFTAERQQASPCRTRQSTTSAATATHLACVCRDDAAIGMYLRRDCQTATSDHLRRALARRLGRRQRQHLR